ncbi:MAG: hypothetical protein LQ350_003477 [Teloschistes chrysophthalmus]|nr:MAG: hypothetical protein LQ350_003477 [Niorma chrysophthalma]
MLLPASRICKQLNATGEGHDPNSSLNASWTWPPFALFDVVDVPHKTINLIWQRAKNGSTVDLWWFYLAVSDYAPAPKRIPDKTPEQGTEEPIDASFKSPFIGQNEFDVARWLKGKPNGVNLDSHFFGLLDKQAEKSGKVVLCRIGDSHLKGNEVKCLLWDADTATLWLGGQNYGDWDDQMDGKGPYIPEFH